MSNRRDDADRRERGEWATDCTPAIRRRHRAVARIISGIAALAMMLAPLAACAGPAIDVDQLRSQAQSTLESGLRDAGDGLRQLGGEFLEGLLDTDAGTTADGRSPSGSTDAGANPNGQSQGSPGTGTGDGANSDDAFSWWESASPGSGTSNGRTLRFGTTKDTLPAGYSYTQLDKTTGEAALADSCDPISYAVADGATDAQVALVDRAVSRIAEITGLRFQKVGHVEDSHADGADGASGDDPAQTQYLFSFLDAAQYPNFTESAPNADGSRERTLGETRSRSITGIAEDANGGDLPFIYYAAIALNQAYFGDGGDAWGDQDAAVEVIEHELAHALGLGHTEVPGSMMNPYADGTSGISDTDMQALRALVRECLA